MGDPIVTPMLVGAGVGALGGAITGNNPFKTALLGGALGTGYGALGGMGGASAGIAGATSSAAPAASLAVPTAEELGAGFGYTASGASPFAAGEVAGIPTAADIGAGLGVDTLDQMAISNPSLWEKLKPYATVSNLSGAANIANQFKPQPKPMIAAPSGGVSRGQAPQQSGLILTMDDLMKLQQSPQRKPISLLVR